MIAVNNEDPPNALGGLTESRLAELIKGYQDAHAWDELINLHMIILNYQLLHEGSDHPQLIHTYSYLGHAYQEKKDYDKAIAYYSSARRIILQEKNFRDYQLALSYDSLGKAQAEKKEYDRALECFDVALKGFRSLSRVPRVQDKIANCYNNIGETLRRKGNLKDAARYLEQGLELALEEFGENSHVAIKYGNLGKLAVQKGEFDKALSYLNKAKRILFEGDNPDERYLKKWQKWIVRAEQGKAEAGSKKAQ